MRSEVYVKVPIPIYFQKQWLPQLSNEYNFPLPFEIFLFHIHCHNSGDIQTIFFFQHETCVTVILDSYFVQISIQKVLISKEAKTTKKKEEIKPIIISARNSINYFPLGLRLEEHQDITFYIVILVI